MSLTIDHIRKMQEARRRRGPKQCNFCIKTRAKTTISPQPARLPPLPLPPRSQPMTDKCPKCGAGWTRKPYSRKGWKFCDCGRRWHPVHGWEAYDNTCCLARQLSAAQAIIDKLPKDETGSVLRINRGYWTVQEGEIVFCCVVVRGRSPERSAIVTFDLNRQFYSTIEAAYAAGKETQ